MVSVQISYMANRGYHYGACLKCRYLVKEAIPDQADDRFVHNPANPWLGLCAKCNGGTATFAIQLGNSSVPSPPRLEDSPEPEIVGAWGDWLIVAKRYARKARYQDRQDLRHSILVRLCEVANRREAEGQPLTELGMLRTASLTTMEFWHAQKRNGRIISLDLRLGEYDEATLADTIADDRAIDLVEWLNAKAWLLGCPRRLVEIAHKKVVGLPLTHGEICYLSRFRASAQMSLFR